MPRRMYTVYAATEADARDMAERRARDAHLDVIAIDEVMDLEPHRNGLRPFVVWLAVR